MFLKNRVLLFIVMCICFTFDAEAQIEDSTTNTIDTVRVTGKKWNFKTKNLYDDNLELDKPNIHGFYALNIFDGRVDKQIWISTEKNCIESEKINKNDTEKSLILRWDKISGGCTWIGMGFGWDNWKPKDMSLIVDSAFIEIEFSSPYDTKNIPVAFALEDYSGTQAYQGFNMNMISNSKIVAAQKNTIKIPLNKFPFKQTDTDVSNIKQFMIQFEADGALEIHKINIRQ